LKFETILGLFLLGLGFAGEIIALSTRSRVLLASMNGEATLVLIGGLASSLVGLLRGPRGRRRLALFSAMILIFSVGSIVYINYSNAFNRTSPSEGLSPQVGKAVVVRIVGGALYQTGKETYSPGTMTLVFGVNNTVTWENADVSHHTTTGPNRLFESGNINPGQNFTYTFTLQGIFAYTCDYHPWMKGTVVVKTAS
jgi:plastocyanin